MKSRKFLSDIKKYYGEIFELHQFSNAQVEILLHGKSDISKRISYIKEIYDCMLGSSDEIIRAWLTSSLSLSDVAAIKGENTSAVKSRKYYLDKTLAEWSQYKDGNILRYIIITKAISEDDWTELHRRIAAIRSKLYPCIIDRKQILINIPAGEVNTVAPSDFDKFLKIVEAYSVEHRKKMQQQINQMKEAVGYFNYLNTAGSTLSREDIVYRERIMNIFNASNNIDYEVAAQEDKVPIIKDSNNPWIPSLNKYYKELNEEEKQKYLYKKSKKIKI